MIRGLELIFYLHYCGLKDRVRNDECQCNGAARFWPSQTESSDRPICQSLSVACSTSAELLIRVIAGMSCFTSNLITSVWDCAAFKSPFSRIFFALHFSKFPSLWHAGQSFVAMKSCYGHRSAEECLRPRRCSQYSIKGLRCQGSLPLIFYFFSQIHKVSISSWHRGISSLLLQLQ